MAAVALPQYANYQKRARGAEAKSALGALLVAMQAYHAENSEWTDNLKAVGYSFAPKNYDVIGFTGTVNTNFFKRDGATILTVHDSCDYTAGAETDNTDTDIDERIPTFKAGAFGAASKVENWQVNEQKEFKNLSLTSNPTQCS